MLAVPRKRGHDGEVGHIPRGEQQRALSPRERRQLFFQPRLLNTVAGYEMRRAAARAPMLRTGGHRRGNSRMTPEREIVVAGKVDERSIGLTAGACTWGRSRADTDARIRSHTRLDGATRAWGRLRRPACVRGCGRIRRSVRAEGHDPAARLRKRLN